jgi:5-methylcytosine-specific restriction protein A
MSIIPTCRHPGCFGKAPCSKHPIAGGLGSGIYEARDKPLQHLYTSARWVKYRAWFKRQGACDECGRNHALCEHCAKAGRIEAAYAVDHIRPHRGDLTLFWDHANHQSLCESCHNAKSVRERLDRQDRNVVSLSNEAGAM